VAPGKFKKLNREVKPARLSSIMNGSGLEMPSSKKGRQTAKKEQSEKSEGVHGRFRELYDRDLKVVADYFREMELPEGRKIRAQCLFIRDSKAGERRKKK
jgi:hypothetical protein